MGTGWLEKWRPNVTRSKYRVLACDGGPYQIVGEFTVGSDATAQVVFDMDFKRNKEHDPDYLSLYRLSFDSRGESRELIDYRDRIILAPRKKIPGLNCGT